MGQCWTQHEWAEMSLNVLVGMTAVEARARASAWPDVTFVESYITGDLAYMGLAFGRVRMYLTHDHIVQRATYVSRAGTYVQTAALSAV